MKEGFIRCGCATVDIKVADTDYNTENIIKAIKIASDNDIKLLVFPELCITGYTCGDLFLYSTLLSSAKDSLIKIAKETKNLDIISVVGLPFEVNHTLYNCGAVINKGEIKGLVPKMSIPNYAEFYEMRNFTEGRTEVSYVNIDGYEVPFGANILFTAPNCENFTLALEICEDLWTPNPPSVNHATAGATVIANLSASNETVGKADYREMLVKSQSAKLYCGYIYADAGYGESTTDLVFAGDNMIAENGTILARSKRFNNECVYSELDLERLVGERKKSNTYKMTNAENYVKVNLDIKAEETPISRNISKLPFVPCDKEREDRCEEILSIQSMALKKRLDHTNAKTAVIGISGGLDSTLALLVTVRAFDALGLDR
ncbi:MAG: NAD(+) synthase, partial [Clostridia bacterium]|nr:NAD(+) synthase [Clostridia bacterium]